MADKLTGHGLTPEQMRLWVESSCAARGVPVLVSDLGVLARVSVLLGGTRGKPAGARDRLQPPLGRDPLRVQACPSRVGRGEDYGVVQDGFHDGRLAG